MEWIAEQLKQWADSHNHTQIIGTTIIRDYPVGSRKVKISGCEGPNQNEVYIELEGQNSSKSFPATEEEAKDVLPQLLEWLESTSKVRGYLSVQQKVKDLYDTAFGSMYFSYHDLQIRIHRTLGVEISYQHSKNAWKGFDSELELINWLEGLLNIVNNPTQAYFYYLCCESGIDIGSNFSGTTLIAEMGTKQMRVSANRVSIHQEKGKEYHTIDFIYYLGNHAMKEVEQYFNWLGADD